MSFVTVGQGAILEKRIDALEARLAKSDASANEAQQKIVDGVRQLDESKNLSNDAVATEIQNCKTEAETMRNDVKSEILTMRAVIQKDSDDGKMEVQKISTALQQEIEEMKKVVTKVSSDATENFANMVVQHQGSNAALQTKQDSLYTDLFNRMKATVEQWEARMGKLEATGGVPVVSGGAMVGSTTVSGGTAVGGGSFAGDPKKKGYIPLKQACPDAINNEIEKWRSWKRDVLGYFDTQTRGMKNFLMEIEQLKDVPDMDWLRTKHPQYGHILDDRAEIWRALHGLTKGEAKKVIESVGEDDGWAAWLRLNQHFTPGLEVFHGQVWADLSALTQKPAKTPEDTKRLITELCSRIKRVEDITGETVNHNQSKSILLAAMDPLTKRHTSSTHGTGKSFQELKNECLRFINENATVNPNAMVIDSLDTGNDDAQDGNYDHLDNGGYDETEDLVALGKGKGKGGPNTVCYGCGGKGHIARDCPRGRGKGF